ncbi:Mechanosensitive ion channel protein [Sterolibacterium denitrificans]|uniref:Small-conductance mechanosensitive channel n=1 Tax=Sterolibacterium denitrificans TaxID=157592 RepID=A0A7Z7HSQ9_9PROT|nr:Mechanosensitive ion channel protein [Sterolibacterium denitrificans]
MVPTLLKDLANTGSPLGISFLGCIFFVAATVVVVLIRRATRRLESHLVDITALRFVSALAQVLTYLMGFVLYAHLVPGLRSIGTALLAGVSVASVVMGLAAQSTLSNLIAGFSLVLYRPFSIGDTIRLNAPTGVTSARVKNISLGFTILQDDDGQEIIVPNSVMIGSTIVRLRRARD